MSQRSQSKRIIIDACRITAVLLLLTLLVSCSGIGRVEICPPDTIDIIRAIVPEPPYVNPDLDYLVLVDSSHPLPEGWEGSIETESFVNAVGDEVKVERTAYEAYLKLKEALEKEGVYIDLDSAYRSVAEQQKIVDDFTEKYGAGYARTYAAVPGYSEHHTGLALDVFLIVNGNIVYENEDLMKYPEIWEKIHARLTDYGFILRYPGGGGYPYEPWHIRYVGKTAAKEMEEKGLSFEEYLNYRNTE